MEITGRLIMVLPLQQGTGKSGTPWQKQEFIIETIEQYPKKICANLWGDKTDALQRLQIGTVVKMSFSLESREFNGKWYTDVRAWKLELADAIPAGYGQPAAMRYDESQRLVYGTERLVRKVGKRRLE